MNLRKTIKIQRILIAILLVLSIVISLMSYKLQIELVELTKENESLKGKIEMQQSVIADLEENLKNK